MENIITYTCVTLGAVILVFFFADMLFGAEAVSETVGSAVHVMFY